MPNKAAKKEYDMAAKSKAYTGFVLRVLVSAYLVYLSWKILSDMFSGNNPIPPWTVWLICAVFVAFAIGFCVYGWKAFRKALQAAELLPMVPPAENLSIADESDTEGRE